MIRTVFFDFGGTLAWEPFSHEDSLYAFLQAWGIEAGRDEVEAGVRAMEAYGAERARKRAAEGAGHDNSKTLAERYWFNVCLRFAQQICSIPDSHDLAELLHASHDIIPYEVYDDTVPALKALSARSLNLGLISNWDAPTLEFATRDLGIRKYFKMVLSSRCAEYEKPRPEIFHEACQRADAEPASSVHIGDSIEADIAGARGVGITPIWINRNGAEVRPDCATIQSLAELPDVLDRLAKAS